MPTLNEIKLVDYTLGMDRENAGQVRPAMFLRKLDTEGRILLTVFTADEGDYKPDEWRCGLLTHVEAAYDYGTEAPEHRVFMPGTWHWPKAGRP